MHKRNTPAPIVAHGLAVGLDSLEGLLFNPNYPYRYCRICGALYQTDQDRNPPVVSSPFVIDSFEPFVEWQENVSVRQIEWSVQHANIHSPAQHRLLQVSSQYMTPEATNKLAAFGIVPVTDILNGETVDALANAPAIPTNDAEG